MNPFMVPRRVLVKATPQDMRAGIERLASVVASEFDRDARDGTLYAFVSRDRRKVKMVRFDGDQACLWYVRSFGAAFPISWGAGLAEVDGAELLVFLRGAEPLAAPERWSPADPREPLRDSRGPAPGGGPGASGQVAEDPPGLPRFRS